MSSFHNENFCSVQDEPSQWRLAQALSSRATGNQISQELLVREDGDRDPTIQPCSSHHGNSAPANAVNILQPLCGAIPGENRVTSGALLQVGGNSEASTGDTQRQNSHTGRENSGRISPQTVGVNR